MATTTKHNIYLYIRVVTKYFYGNYNIYGLSSRPNNSPATRNANSNTFYQIIYLYYVYLFYLFKLRYYYHKYSYFLHQNSLSSIYLLKYHHFSLTSTNYPVTTHLSQFTLYNPVSPIESSDLRRELPLFRELLFQLALQALISTEVYVENTQYLNSSVLSVDVNSEVTFD